MTLKEQLDLWVAGQSVHRPTTGHGYLEIESPPGVQDRVWRCNDCGARGKFDELRKTDCSNPAGECCPDFSCCYPDMLMPAQERRAYRDKRARQ